MAKLYNFIRYKTSAATGEIDYDELRALAKQHQPKLILVGYSSYNKDIDYTTVKQIADEVGALTMADISHIAGLIASGLMNNPVPLFDVVSTTTHKTLRGPRGGMIMCKQSHAQAIDKAVFPGLQGGPHENNIAAKAVAFGEALKPEYKEYCQQILKNTKTLEQELIKFGFTMCFGPTQNHLILVDLTNKGLGGKVAQNTLDKALITLNKNVIPNDTRPPLDPSGIRLGSPAVTTRGMKETEMVTVAKLLSDALDHHNEEQTLLEIREQVKSLTSRFPLYTDLSYMK